MTSALLSFPILGYPSRSIPSKVLSATCHGVIQPTIHTHFNLN
jgi:hypothetical protein